MPSPHDERAAQVRELLTSAISQQRAHLDRLIVDVLVLVDQPGFPGTLRVRERALVEKCAGLIRHLHALEAGPPRMTRKALQTVATADEQRILAGARQVRAFRRQTHRPARSALDRITAEVERLERCAARRPER